MKVGYSIDFLAWDQSYNHALRNHSADKDNNPMTLKLNSRLNYFISMNIFFSYFILPLWWLFVLKHLLIKKFDVIHVINFQSLIPSIIAGKLKGVPVIYEIEDTWFDQIKLPSYIRQFFIWLENIFMFFSTAIILS